MSDMVSKEVVYIETSATPSNRDIFADVRINTAKFDVVDGTFTRIVVEDTPYTC